MTAAIQARLLRLDFHQHLQREADGTPTLPPDWVAGASARVAVLDVRDDTAVSGPLGHLSLSHRVRINDLGQLPELLGTDTPVVLVCDDGRTSAIAARYVELLGMEHVAAMRGGVRAWKQMGFLTEREPAYLDAWVTSCDVPAPHTSGPLTVERIQARLREPGAVRWVKLAALVLHGKHSCVDGRDDESVVGTPGGDMGELMLALSAAEAVRGEPIPDAALRNLLRDWIDAFGSFYLHSDMDAHNRVIQSMRADPKLDGFLPKTDADARAWREFFASPPAPCRERLMLHLCQPAHLGCGHLKFAGTYADEYGVRPGLVPALLDAFHRERWEGAPELDYVTLGGDHAEEGVLIVTQTRAPHGFARVPMISPTVTGKQLFIVHPQIAAYLRSDVATFFVREGLIAPEQQADFIAELALRAERQAAATLGRLAVGKPRFHAVFDDQGVATVTQG